MGHNGELLKDAEGDVRRVSEVAAASERVAILVDTPNIGIEVRKRYGWSARPDYSSIYGLAESLGAIDRAVAFVNPGVNPRFADALGYLGYRVRSGWGPDVDDVLIAEARSVTTDWLLLCAGDGGYAEVVEDLQVTGTKLMVIAVPGSCSWRLRKRADAVIWVPLL